MYGPENTTQNEKEPHSTHSGGTKLVRLCLGGWYKYLIFLNREQIKFANLSSVNSRKHFFCFGEER